MIPVLGFATLRRFDLADRLLASIDVPIENLVIVDNSGLKTWEPKQPEQVKNLWLLRVPYGLGLVGAWNLIIKSTPYAPYWILVNDDAHFEPGALEIIARDVDSEALNFVDVIPEWSCVVFGEGAIAKAGLYDERFYPLYFDDDDLKRRMDAAGIKINRIEAKVHHDNSATLKFGYQEKNNKTFQLNQALYQSKIDNNDYTEGNWSLQIRRNNSWD